MDESRIAYHEDAELFRDALRFSAAETGFSERLIEKDYYCSVVLADLAKVGPVFKGGTSLSKVHADFYRLSEDLDFGVSTPIAAQRNQRSKQIAPYKSHFQTIEQRLRVVRIAEPLSGFNNSMQYAGRLAYRSTVTGQDDFISIEISVREPIVESPHVLEARTLLIDPFQRRAAVPPIKTAVLTIRETYAEKLRAALTRRDPAIRDFFDVDHAFAVGSIGAGDKALTRLLQLKLSIPGNQPIDMSVEKLDILRGQRQTQLKSVLRSEDFLRFDLDRAFARVAEMVARL